MTSADTMARLEVGDRVRYDGHVGTVHQMTEDDASSLGSSYVLLRFPTGAAPRGAWSGAPRGYSDNWRFYFLSRTDHDLTRVEPEPVRTPEEGPSSPAEAPEESPEVTALRTQVERLQRQISTMTADVEKIGYALKETANRHEWCGEYEDHLSDLVDSLSHYSSDVLRATAERQHDYDVTVEMTTSNVVRVRAESAEAAEELVRYSPWDFVDQYELRDNAEVSNVEAEEA